MAHKTRRWILDQVYQRMVPKNLKCSSCGTQIPRPADLKESGLDTLLNCPQCDWHGTIDSLMGTAASEPEEITEQPRDSRIELKLAPNLSRTWVISASRRFNFLLGFGIFWLLFVGAFTGMMLISGEEDFEDTTKLGALLFLIPFWLAGLGMLITGLWMALGSQELTLNSNGSLLSVRRFLGVTFRRKLETDSTTRVRRVIVYEKNDIPVFTVEISGKGKGRIQLSSSLSEADKGWMQTQLRTALGRDYAAPVSVFDGVDETNDLAPPTVVQREISSDHLTIRRTGSQSFEIILGCHTSKIVGIAGAIFIAVAGFLAWDSVHSFLNRGESDLALFDWPFILIPGFMALIFGAIGILAIWSVISLKDRRRSLQFRKDAVIAEPEWILGTSGGTFRKVEFDRVAMNKVGNSNGDPRFSVKLIGRENAVTICRFRNAEEAGLIAAWVRKWLAEG